MDNDKGLLTTGEKDIEKLFEILKEKMPIPEPLKEPVLKHFTYVLTM
jgi:hypothetical protein